MDLKKEIIRITSEYLKDNLDFLNLSKSSKDYKDLLLQISSQEIDFIEGGKDLVFDNGKALGTYWAVSCIDDMVRTRQFVRGIDEAIKTYIQKKKPIHILYAGTGPFATLMLPLLLRYPKKNIKYTFLEINPTSYNILKSVIQNLGLENYNISIEKKDATKYLIPPDKIPDIIVSETMQNALAKEQQVSIFLNLMKQVPPSTTFIPEKINLYMGLKNGDIPTEKLQKKDYLKEAKVFELSKASSYVKSIIDDKLEPPYNFPITNVVIDNKKMIGKDMLVLLTEIQVFADEKININESGLTTPYYIKEISNNQKPSIKIETQYKISSHPKLEYKITT